MKKIFGSASDVIHLFAQKTQYEAKSSNVFFYGDKIYSYGYHYQLAEFINCENGLYILINDRGYSVTTAKHISIVTQATRQYKQVFETQYDNRLVFNELENLFNLLDRARKPMKYIKAIARLLNSYFENCKFTGRVIDTKIEGLALKFNLVDIAAMLEKENKWAKRAVKSREQKEAEKIAKFRQGKQVFLRGNFDLLRLSNCGQLVETSQGIKVPLNDAKSLFNYYLDGKYITGLKIGDYTVKRADNECIIVGCHRFTREEVINFFTSIQ